MTTESDADGRGIISFMAHLAAALSAVADHPTSSAAAPQVADALDDLVRAFGHGEHNVFEALKAEAHLTDPWARSMPKIFAEITATHMAFVAVLAAWENAWWAQRISELDRSQEQEPHREAGE